MVLTLAELKEEQSLHEENDPFFHVYSRVGLIRLFKEEKARRLKVERKLAKVRKELREYKQHELIVERFSIS